MPKQDRAPRKPKQSKRSHKTPGRRRRNIGKPYEMVFEDQHMAVVNKAAGLLTVPIPGKQSRNLKDLLDKYLLTQKRRALQVHRIDRYTSGLVVFAKNTLARENLVEQFRSHTPARVYLALVRGSTPDGGTLRHQLKLSKNGFRQLVVKRGGDLAVTHYKVLERFEGVTLVEVTLDTGMKNQIRVQFREAGHPLVGDRHYEPSEGRKVDLDRQALHAWKLGLTHPVSKKYVTFEAEPPVDFARLLEKLRRQAETPVR